MGIYNLQICRTKLNKINELYFLFGRYFLTLAMISLFSVTIDCNNQIHVKTSMNCIIYNVVCGSSMPQSGISFLIFIQMECSIIARKNSMMLINLTRETYNSPYKLRHERNNANYIIRDVTGGAFSACVYVCPEITRERYYWLASG